MVITALESKGTTISAAAISVCAVNAVANDNPRRRPGVDEDSSKLSWNIFSSVLITWTPEAFEDVPRSAKINRRLEALVMQIYRNNYGFFGVVVAGVAGAVALNCALYASTTCLVMFAPGVAQSTGLCAAETSNTTT